MINLRNDPYRDIKFAKGHKRNKEIMVSLDKREDPILRLELYKYYQVHGS